MQQEFLWNSIINADIYNTQEYVWPRVVVSIKRKLKGVFVNFQNFEFETLQIQFVKALIKMHMWKFRKAEGPSLCET